MLARNSASNIRTTFLTSPGSEEDTIFPESNPMEHRLTFIGSQQCIRKLTAENAATHRHAIFTGVHLCYLRPWTHSHALSETERQRMSDDVVGSVPDQGPSQVLLDLERFEATGDIAAPFSLFRGPFGVSKFSHSSTQSTTDEVGESLMSTEDWAMDLDEVVEQDYNELDLLAGLLDIPDDIPIPEPEIWDLVSDQQPALYAPRPHAQISPTYFTDNAEAWSILSHYKDRIVPLISPLGQGQEQSWMNLVMPRAVQTLGELTMNGDATHARLALLNTLLSTSAFHLGNHSTLCIEHWVSVGNEYLQRARNHFIFCLEEASVSTMKRNKYKEILMAILSLSTAYVGTMPSVEGFDTADTLLYDRWSKATQRNVYPASSKPRNSSAPTASSNPHYHQSEEPCTTATHTCASWPRRRAFRAV